LDVAAAQGNFTLSLAEKGYDVIWNDYRSELVDYVKLKYSKGNIIFKEGNIFDLKFDFKINAVVITEIIEHVAHPNKFLIKISSLLNPGGYVYMSTPLGSYFLNKLPRYSECKDPSIYESVQFQPDSNGHIFLLHIDEIQHLAELANLKIISINVCNNPLTSGHMLLGNLLPFIPRVVINLIEKFTQKLPFFIRKKIHSNVSVVFKKLS
jgi:2-polyprenyl-6-hydroxyphenyl methylase/3-demethylubiquinone-9 3-methyltransferase